MRKPRSLANRTPEQKRAENLSMAIFRTIMENKDIPWLAEMLDTATKEELAVARERAARLYREIYRSEYVENSI